MRQDPSTRQTRPLQPGRIAVNVAVVAALLLGASRLPPDTSLQLVQERGSLRVCVPSSYPPLVYGVRSQPPGIDVDLVNEVAARLGLRVQFVENPAIGRDFNPRNWRITRAQCEVIAGGVVASATTRSFLETTQPHLETGWAVVFPDGERSLQGATVAFHAGTSGLDRISLSRALQASGAQVRIVSSPRDLERMLAEREVDVAVTESLLARQLAWDAGYSVAWMPGIDRSPRAFGLWKGDLTLQRGLQDALDAMRSDGTLEAIVARYELAALSECELCGNVEDSASEVAGDGA